MRLLDIIHIIGTVSPIFDILFVRLRLTCSKYHQSESQDGGSQTRRVANFYDVSGFMSERIVGETMDCRCWEQPRNATKRVHSGKSDFEIQPREVKSVNS